MRITKSELREILKEEIRTSLGVSEAEAAPPKIPQTVNVALDRIGKLVVSQLQQIDDFNEVMPFLDGIVDMIERLNEKDFTQSEKVRSYLQRANDMRARSRAAQKTGAQSTAVADPEAI
jgi:hypothetical protein